MHLELDGIGPRYQQLTRALKSAALSGRLANGSALPPSRELAQQLGMSRNTVIAAYEQLRAEGLVASRRGAGTFIQIAIAANEHALPPKDIPPQSRYTLRSRSHTDLLITRRHYGLRYNFQYGEPITNPSLYSAWSRELKRAADYTPPDYPLAAGLPALREAIAQYLARRRGLQTSASRILIVSGSQQAYYLASRVLLDEGDDVAIEDPGYFGVRQILQAHGANIRPVPVDGDGLRCDRLPASNVKLICVTPSHQFPGGSVMSRRRREQLLQYAETNASWVIEDDYDGEFRYRGAPLPALKSLDHADRVIYTGTFSKTLFPSLRLGYMVLPNALYSDFLHAKWLCDFGCSAIDQAALANFLDGGGFERHLRKASRLLANRRNTLIDELQRQLGEQIEIADSNAGMHLLVWLRGFSEQECEQLITRAGNVQLGLYSLAPHAIAPLPRAGLLLGFSGLSPVEIRTAVTKLKGCMEAEVSEVKTACVERTASSSRRVSETLA